MHTAVEPPGIVVRNTRASSGLRDARVYIIPQTLLAMYERQRYYRAFSGV